MESIKFMVHSQCMVRKFSSISGKRINKPLVLGFTRNIGKIKYYTSNSEQIEIYIGRLAGEKTPPDDEWSKQIDLAERLYSEELSL